MASCTVYISSTETHQFFICETLCTEESPNAGTMASSGPALTALLVFAAMSAVLANPYRYPVNSAEVQKLLGGQLLQNAIKQWKLNNAGQQPARYVDLQRQNANAMYNGMDSAQAASCIADENVSIFPLGDLNIRICRTSADCYTFFLRLVDIEVTVVLCEKSGNQLTGYTYYYNHYNI